jgi:aminoglycoside phosphotransferase (APT) family kinase protein
MHDGEADIDAGLVRKLVAAQFPKLAGLAVTEFSSTGSVNAIYRLGDRLYARMPRLPRYVRALEREWQWLPTLAPGLTLQVPEPVALGRPADEYPLTWAVYRRVDGDLLRPNLLAAGGRIRAVIDFGGAGLGDPATDVIPAWAVFGPAGCAAFRDALGIDHGTWNRARGIALHQAAALIPYYAVSNPAFAALGQRTVEQVLADLRTPP